MRLKLFWPLFAWTAVAAAEISTPAPAQLPLDHFTRHDEFGEIKISPDGAHVAMTLGKHGRSALTFVRRADKKLVGGVRAPDGLEINEFHWVSPTRVIYMIAQRPPGSVTPALTGEIVALEIDGSKHLQVYGYRAGFENYGTRMRTKESSYASASFIDALPDDSRHILIAEQPWRVTGGYWRYDPDAKPIVTLLDVYDGSKREVGIAPLASAQLLTDRSGQVRFALGMNAQMKQAVAWRPEPGAPWREFELPGFRKDSIEPLHFGADNRSVYFTAIAEGEGFASLYRLTLEDGNVGTVMAVPGTDVAGVITDLRDEDVIGVRTYTDKRRVAWLPPGDSPSARFHKALERAFPGQTARVTSVTDDGRIAIARVSSDVNPGDFYLVDTQAMKAEFVRASRGWIDPRQMRPREPIQLTARDGLPLHGYLTRPAGDGPHPLVVLPHGGPHGIREFWSFDWEAQLLANRGYAVLQLNFRGSGGYGLAFEEAGYREWGGRMQDDLTDATRWAIEQKVTTGDRICIFGSSYGGYAALMGAAREPDLYRCAIGHAGVYDLELMRTSADIPDSRIGRAYLDKALGTDPAQLQSRSPVHLAGSIRAPVLLIHGTADWRVDYEQAKRMKAALEKQRKPVEMVALKREGHGIYDEETRKEVYGLILAFLDKHLR